MRKNPRIGYILVVRLDGVLNVTLRLSESNVPSPCDGRIYFEGIDGPELISVVARDSPIVVAPGSLFPLPSPTSSHHETRCPTPWLRTRPDEFDVP